MADKKESSPYMTTGGRVRNFLGWAFVISLFAHGLLGPLIPFKQTHTQDQETEKVSVTKRVKVKVPTPPPPTPTPKPTPQPKTTPPPKKVETKPQPKLLIQPPKTNSNSGGPSQAKYVPVKNGSTSGVPAGQGTAAPAPVTTAAAGPPASTPTPKPACATPMKDATMVNGVSPEYPESAREANLGPVTVVVKIVLSASAGVLDASVIQSSNNSAVDRAAISAAKQSSYSPKVENCAPVQGSYSFRANFDPSQ
ncbi:MAG: TonB family protein [Candidatus Eremiobacteraeota bacterium]|nr:TonB family protein [Candidatus Eremiobacteraeota bacterium]